jgi:hypothetical protein
MIIHVSNDHRSHGDYRAGSDPYALPNDRASADVRAFADLYITAEHGTWRNVRVRSDNAIMVYAGTRIDDRVRSYLCPRLDHCPSEHLRTGIDDHAFADHRPRISYRSKSIAKLRKPVPHRSASVWLGCGSNTVDEK